MFRILNCISDSYITSKIINGKRVVDANTGNAGTIDLYKLYDETILSGTSHPIELSRALLKFDLSSLYPLTNSIINLNDPSFKCFLKLDDIYGGQQVPSNITLSLFPLAKSFTEGRGFDVISYRDKDISNWLSSSYENGTISTWTVSGANSSGPTNSSSIDYYSTLYPGNVPLEVSCSFKRGDENLTMDITKIISGTLTGQIPDNGFRLSLSSSFEDDEYTYFVKRFHSRHSSNVLKKPRIEVYSNDSLQDNSLNSYFDYPTTFMTYNKVAGTNRSFYSGSSEISGSGCLMLQLVASKSVLMSTTSWSESHSASITYDTPTTQYFSMSFTGSQVPGRLGVYSSSFTLNFTNSSVNSYIGNSNTLKVIPLWTSLDGTLVYATGSVVEIKQGNSNGNNVQEKNFLVNVTNLKQIYSTQETTRFRLFIQDYNTELRYNKIPIELISDIYNNVYWRLINSYTKEIVIPFETTYNSTKLSSDGKGMYFDVYMSDLQKDIVYELEFLIKEYDRDYLITNHGFRFKLSQ